MFFVGTFIWIFALAHSTLVRDNNEKYRCHLYYLIATFPPTESVTAIDTMFFVMGSEEKRRARAMEALQHPFLQY